MIWVALSIGFLGSLHCIGMCGPIAMLIPKSKDNNKLVNALLVFFYNAGRLITYATIGVLLGLIGKAFSLAGIQNIVSIVIGTILLLALLFPTFFPSIKIGKWYSFILLNKQRVQKLFASKRLSTSFLIGLFNGFLPCGLVYLGASGAIASGSILNAALFMLLFGVGTLPTMMAMSFIRNYVSQTFQIRLKKIIPYAIGCMAILLIVRGLNLGIPYMSPKIEKTQEGIAKHECCKKR